MKCKKVNVDGCPFCGCGLGAPGDFLVVDVSDMPLPDIHGRNHTVRKVIGISRAYAVHCENCFAYGPIRTSQNRAMRDWEKV